MADFSEHLNDSQNIHRYDYFQKYYVWLSGKLRVLFGMVISIPKWNDYLNSVFCGVWGLRHVACKINFPHQESNPGP